jgi:hypothetical protein
MKQPARNSARIERDALRLLKEALSPSASVRALGQSRSDTRYDVAVQLRGGQEILLQLVLWPCETEERGQDREHWVWILPRAAKRLHERLRKQRENFVDLSGTVYLCLPNLLVDRAGLSLPPRMRAARPSFDPFSDRSSLVVRTLLDSREARDRGWGVRELAEAAHVVPATVTRVVHELQRYGVIETKRKGRASAIRLTDAQALFDLWTAAYEWTKNRAVAVHAPIGDPNRFLRRMDKLLGERSWALTLQAGASLIAPHASWERVYAYLAVDRVDELFELADEQGWHTADDGNLVLLKPYYKDSVWHNLQVVQSIPVVSNLQLALDLWNYPLRGREQAEHIIHTQRLFA